ncbi:hypothetical protein POTOM_048768 [Populus tomentosa]|uniref:Retroviral polymerase SH3-like domain-containing protein n=1 Tax=Populus tomentosa TaxID=118781 RepID=A0A8X7YH38_POPTO|nr:hypothetical protein POTOM_048768 [Populus tomentosa]
MEELAWGLKRGDCYFLWVVRASEESQLSKDFAEESSAKGTSQLFTYSLGKSQLTSEESKAYKLFNPITKNIVISRDVQFDKENTWDWKRTDANLFQDSDLYEDASYGTEEVFIGDRIIESHIQPPECEIHTEEQLQIPISHEGTIVPHDEGTSNIPQRQRIAPAWMNDYCSTALLHSGWNSSPEALSLGVPMVAMPQRTDQSTNAKYITDVWNMGVKAAVDAGNNRELHKRNIGGGERGGDQKKC